MEMTLFEGDHAWSSLQNVSSSQMTEDQLPASLRFNNGHMLTICVYSVMFVVSAAGNSTVLYLLVRSSAPRSRINTMLVHLAIADLLVTFLLMPVEISWAWTVQWKGGDLGCRVWSYFRVFGLYLSGFVLICISVDRYYAVLRPLQLSGGEWRGRALLAVAWAASALCSAPQIFMFHVESHPNATWYKQCVSIYFTQKDEWAEPLYSIVNLFFLYMAPLIAIVYCYFSIIREIVRRSRDCSEDRMRRSSLGFLGRARSRTLKMTITIVLVFFICWTPYIVICLWFMVDRQSAERADPMLKSGLFLFACTNSCMNPLVYGAFNVRARAQVQRRARHQVPLQRAGPSDSRLTSLSLSTRTLE